METPPSLCMMEATLPPEFLEYVVRRPLGSITDSRNPEAAYCQVVTLPRGLVAQILCLPLL